MKALKKRPVHMKYPKHLNLAKGGAVVQKFADGGALASTATQPAPISTPPANTLAGPGGTGVSTTAATGAGQTGLTGTISNALGTQNQFQGAAANLTPGTNTAQLNTAYGGVQGALGAQTNLANTVAPQAATAVGNQNAIAAQELAMSQGQGPNPAQTELNTATGQNVAAQAALMAGQRGASANVGQIARESAQQGAATQQQAVGQAATLEAQQQIAAQQNLTNLSNNQVTQAGNATGAASTAQQNEQNILQNANTSLNNADVSMQSNLNNVNSNAAIANQNNNSNIISGAFSGASSLLGFAKGGEIAPNPLVNNQPASGASWAAPQFTQSSASGGPGVSGSPDSVQSAPTPFTTKPKGPDPGALGLQAEDNPHASDLMYDTPGQYGSSIMNAPDAGTSAGTYMGSSPGAPLASNPQADFASSIMNTPGFAGGGRIATGPHRSHVANFLAGGGATGVKAVVSPKEVYLAPEQVHKVLHEGADPMKIGYRFPGKDKVKGRDSKKNDVIPTTLREGGCVIPVHITTHKDSSQRGRKFVARTMAKHMKRPAGAK